MSDFESRVRDALGSGAAGAPDAVGLADAARGRARARRRTTMVVSAVAVLAVVAVPVGVFALRDSGDASSGPGIAKDVTESPGSAVPNGWRTETWRDLEVQVPDDWAYGALSTWCINGDEPGDPVVQRPGGVVEDIACTPSSTYGVQFFDPALFDGAFGPGHLEHVTANPGGPQPYPVGSWLGVEGTAGEAAVRVVAPTEALARQILDSAHRVEGVDSNGCAPEAADAPEGGGEGPVSVCRYDADGLLVQSERLTGQDASDAVAALEAAPVDERWHDTPCPPGDEAGFVRMLAASGAYDVHFEGSCEDRHGVVGPGTLSYLTLDVLHWAISAGWSGGVSGDVPLPAELRR